MLSKVYEQLIINRLREIVINNSCYLTWKEQHRFKQKRSTATAGVTLQPIITRTLDQDKCAIMSSISLSAAFEVVHITLLFKRSKITGLLSDVIELLSIRLDNCLFYIDINGDCSYIKHSETGIYIRNYILRYFSITLIWSRKDVKLCRWQLHNTL